MDIGRQWHAHWVTQPPQIPVDNRGMENLDVIRTWPVAITTPLDLVLWLAALDVRGREVALDDAVHLARRMRSIARA